MKWLKGLADREEVREEVREGVRESTDVVASSQSTVNMVQVVDFLTGKGVSKEEAMEVRTEGEGWRVEGGGWRVEDVQLSGDHFPSIVLW